MRVTIHHGRPGGKGLHNDRNFDIQKAANIDPQREGLNLYWHCYDDSHPGLSFLEAERRFYAEHFSAAIEDRNRRAIEARHPERQTDIDKYLKAKRTCPEETLYYVGRRGDTISPDDLWDAVIDQINWESEHYPQCRVLDVALHADEQGAPHVHVRRVWIGHDADGRELVSQSKALAEMEVDRPDLQAAESRYNCAKITYSHEVRDHFASMLMDRGLELELEPREPSRSGLSMIAYQTRQEQERAEELRQEQARLEQEHMSITQNLTQKRAELEKVEVEAQKAQKAKIEAKKSAKSLQAERNAEAQKLQTIRQQAKVARKELMETLDLKAKAAAIKRPWPFAGRDATVTYHAATLEQVEHIGDRAAEHLRDAELESLKIRAEAQKLERMRSSIRPEKEEAERIRAEAEKLRAEEGQRIESRARTLVREAFAAPDDDRAQRLEAYCDKLRMGDGRSVLDHFAAAEELRLEEAQQALEHHVKHSLHISR